MGITEKTTVRTRARRAYAIPVFCGIFSFFHWFIFFPLLWHFVVQHMAAPFLLYTLIIFVMWLIVMVICLFCWWYDLQRIVPVGQALRDVDTSFSYRTTVTRGSPSFQTKAKVIQPDSNSKTKVTRESEIISLTSITGQSQNTPAMYNLHTGRHSYDSTDVRRSSDSFQRVTTEHKTSEVVLAKKESNQKFKTISSSDSEGSTRATLGERSRDYEAMLSGSRTVTRDDHTVVAIVESTTHERGVHVRTKYDRRATAQEATKVVLPSESDVDDELFRHIDMDLGLSGEIERHVKDAETPDPDKLSQNMPEFDDYLHLVSIETPLSPREVFFSDLIKQASETEQQALKAKEEKGDRHSYCMGDITYNKLSSDDRSSVPLFLYSEEWKQAHEPHDVDQIPEQAVDSGDEEPCEDFGQDRPGSHGTALSPLEKRRRSKEFDELKMLTQLLIDEEKQATCAPEVLTKAAGGEVESGRSSAEELDGSYKPLFPQVKPQKLTEGDESQREEPTTSEIDEPVIEKSRAKPRLCESQSSIFEPSTGKKRSSSEFFIADVDRKKKGSVTSEVYMKVEDSGIVSKLCIRGSTTDSVTGKQNVGEKRDLKRDLSADKLEYKSEDDDVFEDVQSALYKMKRNK